MKIIGKDSRGRPIWKPDSYEEKQKTVKPKGKDVTEKVELVKESKKKKKKKKKK